VPEPPARAPPSDARVSIGNLGIDTMLEGGLVPHRPYLIVGPSGTGKTKLALQFLCEGVRRGERVLLVTVEEPPNEVRLNHRALAPDLDKVEVFDAIPDVMRYERAPFKDIASVREITPFARIPPEIRRSPELSSVEVTITALEQMLRSEVGRRQYSRIAVDSLTALQYFCMKGFDPVGGAQTFLRFLSDLRTTTVLTVESPLEDIETTERTLARGEIRLFRWELDGVTVRAVGVEKLRGSSHDVRLHPYRIGPNGVDVNLGVTISRDTRQIVELPPTIVAPTPEAPRRAVAPALEPLSAEVRDLIALGVDVGPVRGAVEAAIAAVRAGRTEDAVQEISRLSSLTGALTANVAGAESGVAGPASPEADAHRRIAQRADTARVGIPPTLPPAPEVLEEQLDRVLAILPTAPPASPIPGAISGRPAPPTPPAGSASPPPAVPPPVPTPAEVASPPPPPPEPAVEASEVPVAPSVPLPPPPGAKAPERPPARPLAPASPSASQMGGTVPRPAAGRPQRPTVAPAVPMPEPPPLPQSLPKPSQVPAASRSVPSVSGAASDLPPPEPEARDGPVPPPLPSVTAPVPEVPLSAPSGPPVPEPTPKRRRRATPPRKKPGASAEEVAAAEERASTPGAAAASAKPRRRAVRKRKAPPVVGATVEPLPEAAPSSAPPPSPDAEAK